MTDQHNTTPLGPAFDEKAKGLDRRQLLKAGAWAAPVILLATATPAAAASAPEVIANALQLTSMSVDGPGTIRNGEVVAGSSPHGGLIRGHFQFQYQPWLWSVPDGTATPVSLQVTYTLLLNGTAVAAFSGVQNLAQYGVHQVYFDLTGLTAGTHTVVLSASAAPATVAANTFKAAPIGAQANVTVTAKDNVAR